MREEIILKSEMRPAFIIMAVLGLICSVMLFFHILLAIPGQATPHDYFSVIASLILSAFSGWQISRLSHSRHYLETSDDGIMLNDRIRRYIPWSNISDIVIGDAKLASVQTDPEELGDLKTLIYLELKDPDRVFYDNFLHRTLGGWERQLNEQFSTLNNRVPVNTYLMSDLSQETICMLLKRRMERALVE